MYTIEINYKSEKEIEYDKKLKKLKEKWKTIIMDDIIFDYEISNTGKIRHKNSNKELSISNSGKNYKRVTLYNKGVKYKYSVHRLVAIHFIDIPKKYIKKGYTMDNLVPNHLDGIKNHNAVFNLEWSTPRDNTIHAFDTGLADISIGENSHLAKMTNKQAIEVCELLSKGWEVKDISDKLNISKKSIQHIKSRECWTRVSKDYNFTRIGKAIPYTLNDDIIHKICKDLELKIYSDYELGVKYNVSREYIRDIRLRKRRTNISKSYNF